MTGYKVNRIKFSVDYKKVRDSQIDYVIIVHL